MKFELQNKYIVPAINLLQKFQLAGFKSIARTRLIKLLTKQLDALADAEKELAKVYAQLDEKGEPVIANGNFDLKPETTAEYQALVKEKLLKVLGE